MSKVTFADKSQTASYDATKNNAQDVNDLKNAINAAYDAIATLQALIGAASGIATLDANSLVPSIQLPAASAGTKGAVNPGTGMSVTSDGTLNNTSSNIPAGGAQYQVLSKNSATDFDTTWATLEQPIASSTQLGSIKVGTGLQIDGNGVLSVT